MGMAKRKAHIQGYAATGGQMEESVMEAFEPPEAGKAPAGVKKILKEVYNGCRADWAAAHPADRENAGNKESCSRIAWHAVKQAGWREEGGVWRREHVSMDEFFTTLGDTARVRMEGRKGMVRQSAEAVLRAYHRRLVSEGDPEDGGYYAPHYGRPGERGGSLPRDSGGGGEGKTKPTQSGSAGKQKVGRQSKFPKWDAAMKKADSKASSELKAALPGVKISSIEGNYVSEPIITARSPYSFGKTVQTLKSNGWIAPKIWNKEDSQTFYKKGKDRKDSQITVYKSKYGTLKYFAHYPRSDYELD